MLGDRAGTSTPQAAGWELSVRNWTAVTLVVLLLAIIAAAAVQRVLGS